MKKWLAILLVVCMLPVSALASVSEKGVYPITDEDVTLKIWVAQCPQTEDPETMEQAKWYEEFSGVKVEWVSVPYDEMEMLFNLAVSDPNNLPDIFMYAVDSGELLNLVEDGVVLPLDGLMEEHGYYYPQMLDELGIRDQVTAPDGHIYSFLASVYLVQNSMFNKVWVLRDWLKQYNTANGKAEDAMPETTQEFYDLLAYFKANDMNGNGKADEIPLMGNSQLVDQGTDPMFYFLNSFLYCPNDFIVADAEHNLSLACTEDAFRDGLKYLNSLYKAGFLTDETFTQNLTQMRQITSVYESEAIAGVVAGMNPMRVVNVNPDPEKVSYDDYVAIPPVAGPEGVRIAPRRAESQLDLRCFITSACKNPEVAYKWLDYWSSKEGSIWSSYLGQENVHWAWADEPSFGGDAKSVKSMVEWTSPQSVYWTITWFAQYYITEEMFFAKAASGTYSDNELTGSLAEQAYMPYARMTEFPQIAWCADPDLVTEKAELTTLFNDHILNNCVKFIMGTLDPESDADWQAFQDSLKNLDADHYLDVIGEYYWAK